MIDFLIQNFESNCHYLVKKSLGHFYEILLSLSAYLKARITEKMWNFIIIIIIKNYITDATNNLINIQSLRYFLADLEFKFSTIYCRILLQWYDNVIKCNILKQ